MQLQRLMLFLILLIGVGLLCGASDSQVSPRLKVAKARHDQAVKAAETAYLKADLAAKQAYLKDVKTALTDATKSGKLDEANSIKALQEELESDIEVVNLRLNGAEKSVVKVAANQGWQKSISVHKDDTLIFSAAGTWCSNVATRKNRTIDADGLNKQMYNDLVPNTPLAALIGQIGSQQFLVGRSAKVNVEQDGDLEMRINDKRIDDNDGELTVTIIVKGK